MIDHKLRMVSYSGSILQAIFNGFKQSPARQWSVGDVACLIPISMKCGDVKIAAGNWQLPLRRCRRLDKEVFEMKEKR